MKTWLKRLVGTPLEVVCLYVVFLIASAAAFLIVEARGFAESLY